MRTKGVWVEATTSAPVLTVTEIIPTVLTAGTAPTTVHVYGDNFTATTEILFNGVAVAPPAALVAIDHMTVGVDPTLAVPGFVTVTAREGATASIGAAGLHVVPASTTTPTVTEIVPAVALVGMSAALPAKVYGTGFTAASVVNWNGVAIPTAFVSATELNITIDTNMGVAPSVAYITVVGATGAAGFHFIPTSSVFISDDPPVPQPPPNSLWWDSNSGKFYVLYDDGNTIQWVEITSDLGTELDFGIGLTKDDTTTPPIVHLQPAGDSPATLGGVYVVDRVRNISEGLELGIDGRLRAPLATDSLAGTLLEPPPDDKGYVRRRTPAGVSDWVPPADTLIDFGIGLSKDETAVPPIVHLDPAGPTNLGGVFVPVRDALVDRHGRCRPWRPGDR
jgi:hypothetical protein